MYVVAYVLCALFAAAGGAPVNTTHDWYTNTCPNPPLRPDTYCCANGEKLGSTCGSDDGMSCSPFTYRPYTFNKAHSVPDPCKGDPYLDVVSGAEDGQGARAWTSYPNRTDYFAFHGCDGAGIQSDCWGDIKYIERFEGYNKPGTTVVCDGPNPPRNQCMFVHPATRTVFDRLKYWAGWYNYGEIDSSICKAGADRSWDATVCNRILDINNGKNPYAGTPGVRFTFSFLLYPWICQRDSSMANNNFFSPTLDNTGGKEKPTSGWKCYVDNEPGTLSSGQPGWPPYIEIYYFGLYKTSDGKDQLMYDKWAITDSDTPAQIKSSEILYQCHQGDGSSCPW